MRATAAPPTYLEETRQIPGTRAGRRTMSTAVGIMDRDSWQARTDNLAIVDPASQSVLSIPRDLWCESFRNRINTAFARGGHRTLRAGLAELGYPVDHTVCVRRGAVERALIGVQVVVPVRRRLVFLYPLHPTAAIEDGAKWITFEPPAETLTGERIHQWAGASRDTWGHGWDLFRIERQQILVRRLLETSFPFERVLADPALVSISDPEALKELARVRADWRFAILDDVRGARIDGKDVLLLGRPAPVVRAWLWMRWHARRLRRPSASLPPLRRSAGGSSGVAHQSPSDRGDAAHGG
jgi:LytR_cpsA_psr family